MRVGITLIQEEFYYMSLFQIKYDFDTEALKQELLSVRDQFESYTDDRLDFDMNNWLILRSKESLPVLNEECDRFRWIMVYIRTRSNQDIMSSNLILFYLNT